MSIMLIYKLVAKEERDTMPGAGMNRTVLRAKAQQASYTKVV